MFRGFPVTARWRGILLGGVTAVLVTWASVSSIRHLSSTPQDDRVLLASFAIWIVIGGLLDVRLPSGSLVISPVTIAVAMGLPLITSWASLSQFDRLVQFPATFGLDQLVLVTTLGLLISAGLARLLVPVHVGWMQRCSLIISVLVTGVIYRSTVMTGWAAWQTMLAMLVSVAVPGVVWIWLVGVPRPTRSTHRLIVESTAALAPVGTACLATAIAIAFGARALGVLAVPLVAAPLVLMRFAFERQERQRSTRRQSIVALARLTEVAGYTRAGHSRQVALLCRGVGERLGMTANRLSTLEDAALLHDIGQVSLDRPIPDGATTEAAPLDQRAIAEHSATIVRRTGRMNEVAAILQEQATPYHLSVTEGLDISLGSRILKVCNAYADHQAGDPARHTLAMERLYLGLGYEYDPQVIEALQAVLGQYAAAP